MVQRQHKSVALSPECQFLLGKLSNGLLEYVFDETRLTPTDFQSLTFNEKKTLLEYYYKRKYQANITEQIMELALVGDIVKEYTKPIRFKGYQNKDLSEGNEFLFT